MQDGDITDESCLRIRLASSLECQRTQTDQQNEREPKLMKRSWAQMIAAVPPISLVDTTVVQLNSNTLRLNVDVKLESIVVGGSFRATT